MLTGVMILLLLLIVLLAIPVVLTFQVSRQQAFQGDITVLWFFGRVRVKRPLSRSKGFASKDKVSEKQTRRFPRSSDKNQNAFAVLKEQIFRRRIIRFFGDFWYAIHMENVRLRVLIGLGDPAETGQLWAFVGPVAGMLASIQKASIEVEPDFSSARFELDGTGCVRFMPLHIIYLVVGLFLSPTFWQGMRQVRAEES